eukprot:GAFH01001444.1.p1 GENE.GAFH01001444.1~~GAFH01001444.1.p1  ORF type:complete len:528 (-),score=130.42 GAFH01001444.1:41-1588(-)
MENVLEEEKLRSNLFGEDPQEGPLAVVQAPWNVHTEQTSRLEPSRTRASWVDEDDESLKVDLTAMKKTRKLRKNERESVVSGVQLTRRLREQYTKINQTAEWAKLDEDQQQQAKARAKETQRLRKRGMGAQAETASKRSREEEPEAAAAISPFASAEPLTAPRVDADASATLGGADGAVRPLPAGVVNIRYVADANQEARATAQLSGLQFHPNGQLLMTASLDSTLKLFQIDGRENPKVSSVSIEKTPIRSAHITPDGRSVLVSGRRKYFFQYDVETSNVQRIAWTAFGRAEKSLERMVVPLPASPQCPGQPSDMFAFLGNDGYVMLMSLRTMQQVGSVKANRNVADAFFTPDGHSLLTYTVDGEINVWDLGTRRCSHVAQDAGGLGGASICMSPDGRFITTGSASGIVNFYQAESVLRDARPTPLREFKNLQTRTGIMAFNSDASMLGMASVNVQSGLRLVHTESRTVFSNWPTRQTPLAHVSCLAFSPGSGYMAVGNSKGRALLYRLAHYSEA